MSAAVLKRSNTGGSASITASTSSTQHHGHNTKSGSSNFVVSSSTTATALRKDPAALLARGYTARYIGAVLQVYNQKNGNKNLPSITPLSNEEMDRDLRHISAYQEAATRYHQLTYAATNHIHLNATAAAKNSSSSAHNLDTTRVGGDGSHIDATSTTGNNSNTPFFTTAALPVRIDPEEEKRRLTAQKRIQRAEAVREELEQQYVALRAHYVVTTQELQGLAKESERTIETLQQCVTSTSHVLGYQRAKLQMTRDIVAAYQYRTNMILSREFGGSTLPSTGTTMNITTAQSTLGPTTTTSPDNVAVAPTILSQGSEVNTTELLGSTTSASDHQFPLLAAWTALEENCKRHLSSSSITNGKGGGTAKGSKGKQAATAAASTIIPWSCTKEPATSYGIPMLLSALSTVPEKSIAIQTGNMFGSTNRDSLTWMESHLPSMMDDNDEDDVAQNEREAIEALLNEVTTLEDELLHERKLNQEILVKTGQSRIQQDEWVAMISLVRQETEAVLYRHNVLLESDEVRDAITHMALSNTATNHNNASIHAETTTTLLSHPQDNDEEDGDEEIDDEVNNNDHDDDEVNHDDETNVLGEVDGVGATISSDLTDRSSTEKIIGTDKAMSATALDEEGASEADDEGMEEEGEDVDDWDTNNNNNTTTANAGSNKRHATTGIVNEANDDSEGSPSSSRKRRKL